MNPRPGEVYLVDLGFAGKKRPVVIVSREDPDAPRALAVVLPLTTSPRGGRYEVNLGKLRFLNAESTANAQGIISVEHHELRKPLGKIGDAALRELKATLRYLFDL